MSEDKIMVGCRIVSGEEDSVLEYQEYDILSAQWETIFEREYDGVRELRDMVHSGYAVPAIANFVSKEVFMDK